MMFMLMSVKLNPALVELLSKAVKVMVAVQFSVGASIVPVELKAKFTTFSVAFAGVQAQSVTVMLKLMLCPPRTALFLMYTVLLVL